MVQRGVAPATDNIIAQLRRKFPVRRKKVRWPQKNRIMELRKLIEDMSIEEKTTDKSAGSEQLTADSKLLILNRYVNSKKQLRTISKQFRSSGKIL